MPDVANQPSKPPRTWRPMVLWIAGILLALGLAWFVGAVVVPVWQTRATLRELGRLYGSGSTIDLPPEERVTWFGEPPEAAHRLGMILHLPDCLMDWDTGKDPRAKGIAKRVAVFYLSYCGEHGTKHLVYALERSSRDGGPLDRVLILGYLKRLGPKAGDAVPAIIETMQDENMVSGNLPEFGWRESAVPVRLLAIETLGAIGPGAVQGIPMLEYALKGKAADVSAAAAEALKKIRGEETPK